MKHKNTQPLYIFNRENPQNSEPQNGPRSGLDYIALRKCNKVGLDSFFHLSFGPNSPPVGCVCKEQKQKKNLIRRKGEQTSHHFYLLKHLV